MAKRARERARKTKQDAKRERRHSASSPAGVAPEDAPDEDALMEEFRLLSEGHAAGRVSQALYEQERVRIFGELGLETH